MAAVTNLYVHYVPSSAAAVIAAAIFLVLIVWHLWKIVRTRNWFGLSLVLAGGFEFIGLAARAYTRNHLSETAPFVVQSLLILLAPILYAAGIYMFLGRLIRATGHPQLSFIRLNWLTKIFVCGDIFCFFVQAAGAAKLVNADSTSSISAGQNIILGGLGLQICFFGLFVVCAAVFHYRAASKQYAKTIDPSLRLTLMLFSLYACSLLVTVRNIYRLIEYQSGTDGYLQTHEWPTYGLDVALMAIITGITLSWYAAVGGNRQPESYQLSGRG